MAYKMKTKIANDANYGSYRSTEKIKYIVIHYTGNDGDTDENNGNYFANNVVKASAHYFVDDDSVTQSVPDNYVAWSVGGSKYSNCKTTGGGKLHGKCTNTNSISIELCDDVKNGVVYPSAATIENALQLTKELMQKYGVVKENVIRHFDVTGKSCPLYWCCTAEKDKKWKSDFWNRLDEATVSKSEKVDAKTATTTSKKATDGAKSFLASLAGTYKVTASALNVRSGAGTNKTILATIPKGTAVKCYGYFTLNSGTKWLYVQFTYNGVQYTGFCSQKYLAK